MEKDLLLDESSFLNHYTANCAQLMWFFGAGTSRSAGMPTATDIIWDLKLKYYCNKENQDIQKHDITNKAVKKKIQDYMDSKGFPAMWSSEEYSFYFDLTFGTDYSAQQKYTKSQLNSDKIALNAGHRVIAALLDLKQAKMIFTSNFDDVIETGYSEVAGKNLPTFHLEGSGAALDALNAEQFPIYAKIHGDFRYQSIKNLSQDLLENDEKIKTCFLAGATRYGLVVSGYSGRDENVMRMLSQALDQNNPFPQGLFWTVTQISDVTEAVENLIKKAREKGVKAHIIEVGTFDILMSKIWRQLPNKPDHLNSRVRPALAQKVSISLPKVGAAFPILRTNALPIVSCGATCARIELSEAITYADMKKSAWEKEAKVIITKPDAHVLAWGAENQIRKIFNPQSIKSLQKHSIEDPVLQISQSTFMKSFYEEALVNALVKDKPLQLKSHYNNHIIRVDDRAASNPLFQPLKQALTDRYNPAGYITGSVPSKPGITWAEAVKVKLEERNGKLWVLLTPDIWIFPPDERRNCKDFLRSKKLYRYNKQSFELLDAWIKILFSSIGDSVAQIECFAGDSFSVKFEINTRTAYSQKEAVNVR